MWKKERMGERKGRREVGILVPAALVLLIDVSTTRTRVLSASYQCSWSARSVPQQEKIQDNCEALIVLPPPHVSQTLTFSKVISDKWIHPVTGFDWGRKKKTTARNAMWIRFSKPLWCKFMRNDTACPFECPWLCHGHTEHLPLDNSNCSNSSNGGYNN